MSTLEEMSNKITDLTNRYNDLKMNFQHLRDSVLMLYGETGGNKKVQSTTPPRITNVYSIDECYSEFQTKAPVAFRAYLQCTENGKHSYDGLPTDSCSVYGHIGAGRFKMFLRRYLNLFEGAYVLDVGCGPQDVPLYLEDYPVGLIYGLDPLKPFHQHPFAYSQGLCEHIPWNDDSMDIVIFGTSFDHLFLIDEALRECARVLKVGGFVIVWAGVFDYAKEYNPYDPNFEPYDRYHMFACSMENLLKYFAAVQYHGKRFTLYEVFRSDSVGYFISFKLESDE